MYGSDFLCLAAMYEFSCLLVYLLKIDIRIFCNSSEKLVLLMCFSMIYREASDWRLIYFFGSRCMLLMNFHQKLKSVQTSAQWRHHWNSVEQVGIWWGES